VEHELLTIPEHQSSPLVFSGIPVVSSFVSGVVFFRSLFVLLSFFLLHIMLLVLSVLIQLTNSDYPVGVFKFFLHYIGTVNFKTNDI